VRRATGKELDGVRHVSELPRKVHEIENEWIPLRDGTRLAAKLWLPEGAGRVPVPAILEYIPYRKRDFTAARDALNHPYFAGHGYASVRVDLRGSGDSEGLLKDEYLQQELDDGLEVLRWIAEQPWCDGNIGMIGISWGGFNGLQLAAMRPPELKAIITASSTDDRYIDDVHYMGGCLLGDNLSWSASMFAYTTLPPDPAIVGSQWREMWRERLENSGIWLETWLRHQRRDAYWKHGSICEDWSAIEIPVFAVSGWADGYSNAVFRLLENLQSPCKGLIGPWGHKYPHMGIPGPAIGFLQEAVRWWDQWLKGVETGIMEEPALRVWMQDSAPPSMNYLDRAGRWVGEPAWPSSHIQETTFRLAEDRIAFDDDHISEAGLYVQSPLSVGLFAGKWCSFSATPDLPHDQREEDGGALVFTSPPLSETFEILGLPTAELTFSVDRPVAMVAARLSDVAKDGKATRVTFGLLNLTHVESNEKPVALEPGRKYRARVYLNGIAHVFPEGHRLRLSLSTSYWPIAWPPPEPVQLTIYTGASQLTLPHRKARTEDNRLRAYGEPESAPPLERAVLKAPDYHWRVIRELARDEATLEVVKDEGVRRLESIDLELARSTSEWYTYSHDDLDTVRGEVLSERGLRRGDWDVETITRTVLRSDRDTFYINADIDAYEGGNRIFCRTWDHRIPRDFV
jgi:uncharacterized protein